MTSLTKKNKRLLTGEGDLRGQSDFSWGQCPLALPLDPPLYYETWAAVAEGVDWSSSNLKVGCSIPSLPKSACRSVLGQDAEPCIAPHRNENPFTILHGSVSLCPICYIRTEVRQG